MSRVAEHYREMRSLIDAAAREAGRDPAEILLLAVSKTFPAEAIRELYDAGIRAFGESRITELEAKATALPSDIEWHFIGQLQSNKVRKVLKLAKVIHSVDSPALLERIGRIAAEESVRPQILLEVNVSGETSKAGVSPEELEAFSRQAAACEAIDFQGFMTMAPFDATQEETAEIFETLRRLRDELAEKLDRPLPALSMGMSGDCENAARHGSTIIRVGTRIFGER